MNDPIRILVTSDVHGLIYPYSYADGSVQKQGLWTAVYFGAVPAHGKYTFIG
jgi:hypothetical protein